jgi:uncharacterized protein YbaP (TraB family)
MRWESFAGRLVIALILGLASRAEAASCVWKVSGPNSGTLYLGGSVHALRSTDYPLPAAFNRAFEASTRLALEVDPKFSVKAAKSFMKSGEYPKGDSLKNHVDPRTYDYLRRVFALMKVPEEKFTKLRPWALVLVLWSPGLHGLSADLGVEGFLERRARANSRPIAGLESDREHAEVFSKLTDRQGEALLLFTFISQGEGTAGHNRLLEAWRNGDVETIARVHRNSFRDLPSFHERIIGARNRAWVPKIERFIRSGQTCFVVVGAGHMGGPDGLLALLRTRGYRVEQL